MRRRRLQHPATFGGHRSAGIEAMRRFFRCFEHVGERGDLLDLGDASQRPYAPKDVRGRLLIVRPLDRWAQIDLATSSFGQGISVGTGTLCCMASAAWSSLTLNSP